MEIQEKVYKVLETTSFEKDGKTYLNRDLILKTEERFEREIALTFKGLNCQLLDAIHPGDIVRVQFDPSSKESKDGRYFTTLTAWKIDIIQSATPINTAPQTPTESSNGNVIIPQ